jgi:hypothetical protein
MQGETAATYGYANAAVAQPVDDDLYEAAIDAFANLATPTAVDHGIVANLTDANYCLTKQLEENVQALKEIGALIKKERNNHGVHKPFTPSIDNYCWTRGYNLAETHKIVNCMYPKNEHRHEATNSNTM